MIQENQTKMLNSLLNRYKDKLIIDRILLTEGNSTQLITDPDELLQKCHLQYNALKKKRAYDFSTLDPKWQQTYEPISTISDQAYKDLLKESTLVVRSMNKDSTLGSSTIGYRML